MTKRFSGSRAHAVQKTIPKVTTDRPAIYNRRDTKWLTATAGANTKIVGAILGLALVAPLLLATFLDRSFGDVATIVVLASIAILNIYSGIRLIMKRFILIPLALFFFAATCIFGVYITTIIQW